MSKVIKIIDRLVTVEDDGSIELSQTDFKPFGGGALKLARAFHYMTDWEVLTLQVICRGLPLQATLINIGAGAGTSGLAMTEARWDLIASTYTVDLYEDRGPLGGLVSERNAFAQYNTPLVHQIHADSAFTGENWEGMVDLVFVDGDHNAQGVELDILAWLPHVKVGGYMLFHDYNKSQWKGVKLMVDRYMQDHEKLMVVDHLAVYRIREDMVHTTKETVTPEPAKVKRPRRPKPSESSIKP